MDPAVTTTPSVVPTNSAAADPFVGGKLNQTKRDYARWYDQYEIDQPPESIAD